MQRKMVILAGSEMRSECKIFYWINIMYSHPAYPHQRCISHMSVNKRYKRAHTHIHREEDLEILLYSVSPIGAERNIARKLWIRLHRSISGAHSTPTNTQTSHTQIQTQDSNLERINSADRMWASGSGSETNRVAYIIPKIKLYFSTFNALSLQIHAVCVCGMPA